MLDELPLELALGVVLLGVPLLTFLLIEGERALAPGRPEAAGFLRFLYSLLLPVVAVWITLRWIAGFETETLTMRLAYTALAIALVYAGLAAVQLLLRAFTGVAQRAPKLLIDLGRLLLVAFGAAIVVSEVWGVDLGRLVAALGVGSIVLGLALQNVVGGLVGGVLLLSFRPFKIGDVVRLGDRIARVVQLDWRMVTLEARGEKILVPSGDLSGKAITIIAPQGSPRVAEVTLAIGYRHSPEWVTAALLEAARDMPQLTAPDAAGCCVTAYEDATIRYLVTLPLADPLDLDAARHALLSRFWYVAQRRGIVLGRAADTAPPPDAQAALRERAALLAQSGVFARSGVPLEQIAAEAKLERYRPGEAVVAQGRRGIALLVLVAGQATVTVELRGERLVIEHLEPGDLYATRATFRADPSPVRVEALGELSVLALPLQAVQALLAASPVLARDIESVLEARTEALSKVVRGEGRLRVA